MTAIRSAAQAHILFLYARRAGHIEFFVVACIVNIFRERAGEIFLEPIEWVDAVGGQIAG